MNLTRQQASTAVAIMMAIAMMIQAATIQAAGFSARDGLPQAQKTIQSWKADAVLTRVDTTVLAADGTATMWQYSFFSPGTTSCARAIVLNGLEPRLQDLGKCSPATALSKDFADSTKMIGAAISAGFKPEESFNAYLSVSRDKAAFGKPCWVVHTVADFDSDNAVMRGWCVDPKTGQFLVRLTGQTGTK